MKYFHHFWLCALFVGSNGLVLGLGSGLNFGATSFDFGYSALFFEDRNVTNNAGLPIVADMDGKYESFINVFGLGVRHQWGG